MSVNDTAAGRPRQFLADLTLAMAATAEAARQESIQQCRSDATSYTEGLRARKDDETAALRQAAEADLAMVREWSRSEADRTRQGAEERIARRRRQLEDELQEYSAAVDVELQRVDERVAAFKGDLDEFFERLLEDPDPTSFAMMADRMPDPPNFDDPDPAGIVKDLRSANAPAEPAAPAGPVSATLGDRWWLESPASIAARVKAMAEAGQPG
jgi:hypothetical protein